MNALINAAFSRQRVVVLALVIILAVGAYAYVSIAKEASPEVSLPLVYVSTGLDGINPSDAENLLIKPMEKEFSTIAGVRKIESTAIEGFASVQLEFSPGFDPGDALSKVREAADRVSSELPEDAYGLVVTEINTALFPVVTAVLSGPVPERTLQALADTLKEQIEGLPGVLEVEIGGARSDFLEVLIEPTIFQTYNLSFDELISQIQRNNRLIAAGAIESGGGRIALKVPGLIGSLEDVMAMPVKVRGNAVVVLGDVASIRRTFEDPTEFARIDGQPALALEVKKRSGANIIETVADVRALVDELRVEWPETVGVIFRQDQSKQIRVLLSDLEANVIAAIVLVILVAVLALGFRTALLVGLAIPGAFFAGVTALWVLGYTMNIVVLFSLILVVGLLVDGAIVTTELADRLLRGGASAKEAYSAAAKRMAWPIIASTATTLSVFFPLLFWSGTVGEFMKFLPITVIATLFASLFMALIFIPVIGGIIGKRQPQTASAKANLYAAEFGDPRNMGGVTGVYVRLLQWAILRPWATTILAIALLLGAFSLYGQLGRGLSFFPSVEPEYMQVQVRSRDNLSIWERDALIREVENRVLGFEEVASVYARVTISGLQGDEKTIGTLQLELVDWDRRRTAAEIGEGVRKAASDVAGIEVQVQADSAGPTSGKPIQVNISSRSLGDQAEAVAKVTEVMKGIGGFTDISDTRPLPSIEVSINVDRAEAARYGADIGLIGQAVQLLTQGIAVADYRPAEIDEPLDIRVRFPRDDRTLAELANLRVNTSSGLVPISNFVTFKPTERTSTIRRIDKRRVVTIEANVAPGILVNDQVNALRSALDRAELPEGVTYGFAGETQEQTESTSFLIGAFTTAIFLMLMILVLQFDSFYQALIVLSAIVFSIAGVLLGLIVTGRPFGVVMSGIGVIALAGIVVNNNIVLIDTYNDLRRAGLSPLEAALRTGAQRARPVVLTAVTTALGLLPMVIGVKLNLFTREIAYGAPSTQWWTELSTAIAGGLLVTTALTLVVTPAMLMIGERRGQLSRPFPALRIFTSPELPMSRH